MINLNQWMKQFNVKITNYQLLLFSYLTLLLISSSPTTDAIVIGFIISGIGLALRIWAGGFYQNVILTTAGPYSYCRNPRYLGSFIMGLGMSMAANNIYGLVIFVVSFTVYYSQLIAREEQQLLNDFGNEYEGYRYVVPQFIPRLSSKGVPNKENLVFSWVKSLHYNKEIIVVYLFAGIWVSLLSILVINQTMITKTLIAIIALSLTSFKAWKQGNIS